MYCRFLIIVDMMTMHNKSAGILLDVKSMILAYFVRDVNTRFILSPIILKNPLWLYASLQ